MAEVWFFSESSSQGLLYHSVHERTFVQVILKGAFLWFPSSYVMTFEEEQVIFHYNSWILNALYLWWYLRISLYLSWYSLRVVKNTLQHWNLSIIMCMIYSHLWHTPQTCIFSVCFICVTDLFYKLY